MRRGGLAGQDCASVGLVSGELACSPACLLDVSGCSKCGDGILDADRREECDGTDLGGKTCQDLTGMGGTLACTEDCHLDVSGCEAPATCGNGLLDAGEQCDGANLNGETCQSLNSQLWGGGTLACTGSCTYDTSGCEPVEHCGNGLAESDFGEECDGTDLGGKTCEDLGLGGGDLACKADCTLDTSGCEPPATCGDNQVQAPEQCDGRDLGGNTCRSLGFYTGTLACRPNCTFDTSGCTTCGDGVVNGPGEECDGDDLGGKTCQDLGWYGGVLACRDDCRFDDSDCRTAGKCGDGVLNGPEECDGGELDGQTCEDLGFVSGTLLCGSDCHFDTSLCSNCGNGQRDPGEQCDGDDLGTTTCQDLGYQSGALSCTPWCTYNPANCQGTSTCGNGVKDPREACDGSDFGGTTCTSLGYYGGQIACRPDCTVDLSDCQAHGRCGDGELQEAYEECDPNAPDRGNSLCVDRFQDPGYVDCSSDCRVTAWHCACCGDGVKGPGEECDGDDLGGATCASLGYLGGQLLCRPNCTYDTSGCNVCGNGILEEGEVCDDGNDVDWDGCTNCLDTAILVNVPRDGDQDLPGVGMASDGRFVVVWLGPDGDGTGVFAQRFDAAGNKVGSAFRLNSDTSGDCGRPFIAVFDDGSFVVAWDEDVSLFSWAGTLLAQFQMPSAVVDLAARPDMKFYYAHGGAVLLVGPNGNIQAEYDTTRSVHDIDFRPGRLVVGEFSRGTSALVLLDPDNLVPIDETGVPTDPGCNVCDRSLSVGLGAGPGLWAVSGDSLYFVHPDGTYDFVYRLGSVWKSEPVLAKSVAGIGNGLAAIAWQKGVGASRHEYLAIFDSSGASLSSRHLGGGILTDMRHPARTSLAVQSALGYFVVVWADLSEPGGDMDVFLAGFDALGNPMGPPPW